MLTPPMPNVAGMTDTLDFVKNLWGSMNVPGMGGMGAPALSIDELDKKISDLKAVESWLNLNANMLRTTIQAMEVQRGTIAALKSMSESMTQAMGQQAGAQAGSAFAGAGPTGAASTGAPSGSAAEPAPGPAAGADAMPAAMAWWNLLQEQFKQTVASAMPPGGAPAGTGQEAGPKADQTNADQPDAARSGARRPGEARPKGDKS